MDYMLMLYQIHWIFTGIVSTVPYQNLKHPFGIVVDFEGNLVVSDAEKHQIIRITAQGESTVIVGTGVSGFKDGVTSSAQFDKPRGMAIDKYGNIFVADSANHRIRKISNDGKVSTIAGDGRYEFRDGKCSEASFCNPYGIAIDSDGNIFVADSNIGRIRKINQGMILNYYSR